jgi:hypothetical protein
MSESEQAQQAELAMLRRQLLEVRRSHVLDQLNVTMGMMLVRMVQLRDQAVIARDEAAMIQVASTIREHLRAWHESAEYVKALTS